MTFRSKARVMAMVCRWLPGLCVLVLLLWSAVTRADILVLDACMQRCSESDMKAIGNLRRVFQFEVDNPYVIASPDALLARLAGQAPLSAIQDPLLTPELLEKHLHVGIEKWNAAHISDVRENQEAARSLGLALDEAMANPVVAYANPQLTTLIERAYIGRAICLSRLKRVDEAKKGISDMVRATPDGSILDSYGTDANDVFQLARKELLDRGVGALTIHVDDPDVVFYFNVNGKPHRGVFAADMMLPGVYQVLMIDEAKRSRRYYLNVPPHGHATLDVVWRRDVLFEGPTSQQSRIGFTYPSLAERSSEAQYAGHFAALVPGSLVVVVSRITWDGRDALIGAAYGRDDTMARQVGVIVGTDLMSAHQLATFLVTLKPAPRVIPLASAPWEVPPAPTRVETSKSGWSSTWFIAGGMAAMAAGISLYAINQDPGRRTTPYAIAVGAAGVAAVGVGFGIWLQETSVPTTRPSAAPIVSIGPSHALIGWSTAF